MSEAKHAERKIKVDMDIYPTFIYFEDEDEDGNQEFICNTGESKSIANRIALCWNACIGMSDEVLSSPGYSVKSELDTLDTQIDGRLKAEKEREELLAALISEHDSVCFHRNRALGREAGDLSCHDGDCEVCALIAKIKGAAR